MNNTLITIKTESRNELLNLCRNGISASDAAAICGLNPYKTILDVYNEKLGGDLTKEETESMRQIREFKEYAAERFSEKTGKKVRRRNRTLFSAQYPFMLANVDRMIVAENAGLECCITDTLHLKNFKNGEFPPECYAQCLHHMSVTGADKWYAAVLVINRDFRIFRLKRDDNEIEKLIEKERDFWENNVIKYIPPEPDKNCNQILF
jgi:putative phage-type endonuclease